MKFLIFFALFFPLVLLAEQNVYFGDNIGEAVEQECDSNLNTCSEGKKKEWQLKKTHDHGRHYDHRPRRDYHPRPYYRPRPHHPNQYYYYNPGPYYHPQQGIGHICRNGYYYCGMNYPAALYTTCYCNLGYTFFYGTVTNY